MLFLVSTPIGNFDDITLRSIKTLKECDYILSEDTRETDKLLRHLNIQKPQISYRDQNHDRVINHILNLLELDKNLVLVSDSGTPVISDPGFKLVRDVKAKGFTVVSIPGPSSIIAALSVSGLPADKFTFLGFLPKTKGHRTKLLKEYGETDTTLTIFESPFRVIRLLEEIQEILGDRYVCVANDLTKLHELIITAKVSEILAKPDIIKAKGEFVILIAKKEYFLSNTYGFENFSSRTTTH